MALSPMMTHYITLKEKYKNCILLYRLGDFYEMFFDDAVVVSKELDLTLTGRDCGLEERAPMCGMPYHAVDGYIAKLIKKGFKVAICEQLTDPSETPKGAMVERDVIRVITAGTLTEDNMLDEKTSNYLACIYSSDNVNFGISWCDVSTGEWCLCEVTSIARLQDMLVSCQPAQIICNETVSTIQEQLPTVLSGDLPRFETYYDWSFVYETAYSTIIKQLKVKNLLSFDCDDKRIAISSAGALLQYVVETQKCNLSHIDSIKYIKSNRYLYLDANTKRNLELFETMKDGHLYGSLLWVLDDTSTPMGARKLKNWLNRPLYDSDEINERLDAVSELIDNCIARDELKEIISSIRDIERISSKIAYRSISPKECLTLRDSLKVLPQLKNKLNCLSSVAFVKYNNIIDSLDSLYQLLFDAIDDNAPQLLKDGGYIKKGYDSQLDEYRDIYGVSSNWLTQIENAEREATGIKTLKVGYNRVFGYYIEVTKSFLSQVPTRYIRKQTTINSERFITEELKNIEERVVNSQELALKLESKIYEKIQACLNDNVSKIKEDADAIASIDTLLAFANISINNGYVRPNISKKVSELKIINGRHPVIEKIIKRQSFVTNDTLLDSDDNRVMVITGPNMAGKSTYMRQVALITLMAHIGCYVPSDSANIPLTDRIFTRVGASDDLTTGQSTFMVEMTEVATILKNATTNSLVILDEIGRGTATYDGLSIAWAVMEYITKTVKSKTLFATHYHELTMLEGILPGVKNYRVTVKELNESVVFLHKIARGGANRSFGIEVASLAGIPKKVTDRAKEILSNLEKNKTIQDTNQLMTNSNDDKKVEQISMFDQSNKEEVIRIIKELDINSCTPIKAFELLLDLTQRLK